MPQRHTADLNLAKPLPWRVGLSGEGVQERISRWWAELWRDIEADLDFGYALVWSFLAFIAGIALYFALPAEPSPLVGPTFVLASAIALYRAVRAMRKYAITAALLMAAIGFSIADMRTALVDRPRLERALTADLHGRVAEFQQLGDEDGRIILKIDPGLSRPEFSKGYFFRIKLRNVGRSIEVGDEIAVKARISPPPGAIYPGSYDFSKYAYFAGIGGTGFALGQPKLIQKAAGGSIKRAVERTRTAIGERVGNLIENEDLRALAIALLNGDRAGLREEIKQSLRTAGLAHILAISGLHMSLFAGASYLLLSRALAIIPVFALAGWVTPVSAMGAIAFSAFYLAISGGAVATQRAYLMVLVVLIGLCMGRRTATLRTLALAGFAILALKPELLLTPGFQMSFLAVAGLLAIFSHVSDWQRQSEISGNWKKRLGALYRPMYWLFACALTALVAAVATGPVSLYFFGQLSPLGVVANLLAMPAFSFLVMPSGVLALAFMPLGFEAIPLMVMKTGLELILNIAELTESWTGNSGFWPKLPNVSYLLFIIALLTACVLPLKGKVLAALPAVAGVAAMLWMPPPDLMVDSNANIVGFYDERGSFRVTAKRRGYVVESFLTKIGVPKSALSKHKAPRTFCDKSGCVFQVFPKTGKGEGSRGGLVLAMPKKLPALLKDCARANIIVTKLQAPRGCRADVVVDAKALAEQGSYALWFGEDSDGRLLVKKEKWAYAQTRRPWSPNQLDWSRGSIPAK
nr:ComEC/Rec2 family competence protein [Pseudovibrio flavus]